METRDTNLHTSVALFPNSPDTFSGNDPNYFWDIGYKTVKELETDQGILASGRNELYGAIFGRDSLITSLKLLRVYQQTNVPDFLSIVRKVLFTLIDLQGKEVNIESGEEPGKSIHEYRPEKHEHLTQALEKPWYVYPDKVMRNYDTVDATPLLLITLYRYFQISQDQEFIDKVTPSIKLALQWIFEYGDSNGDGFIDYLTHPQRKFGGLINQNWMDSTESTFHEDGQPIVYPIAPVEAQAYTYLALRLWARYFHKAAEKEFLKTSSFKLTSKNEDFSQKLDRRALKLKRDFNKTFIYYEDSMPLVASGIDGEGKLLKGVRSSVGHLLWAALNPLDDGVVDGILYPTVAESVAKRIMAPDMFVPKAGIRTLSSLSVAYAPNSYHNGSIWPHDNSMIAEGLENYGYLEEAAKVRQAILKAVSHFKTPIELFGYDTNYFEYSSPLGQTACKMQAWSAAAILGSVSDSYPSKKTKRSSKTLLKLPYNLIGFKLSHANLVSLFTDKLKVEYTSSLSSSYNKAILHLVSEIKAVNVVEKLRVDKILGYKEAERVGRSVMNYLITKEEKKNAHKLLALVKEKLNIKTNRR